MYVVLKVKNKEKLSSSLVLDFTSEFSKIFSEKLASEASIRRSPPCEGASNHLKNK